MHYLGWVATTVALSVTPPAVPANLQVENAKPFLVAHATGTQNYICLPSATGVAWTLFGPQATLFDDGQRQILTHFISANPGENGTLRPTWQHSRDTSAVRAAAVETSSDAAYVAPGAIAWLKLRVMGAQAGPEDGDRLSRASFIQRVNTAGGAAPASGCSSPAHIGRRAFVPYAADYVFYRNQDSE